MDYEEAKHLLLLHHGSDTSDAADQSYLEDGFLSSLRPYKGLKEKNFHLVMEALLTCGERINQASQVDRDLILAVWGMCSTARGWGLHPEGMLQRNKLITLADSTRLELWIGTIEDTALRLLSGWPPHRAVYRYGVYIGAVGWWTNIGFFIPLIVRAVSDPDIPDAIESNVKALGKLGRLATSALPALHEAHNRSYTWYIPVERCTQEVRGYIKQAINAIESAV
jgi:hypothetical protein